LIGITGGIAAYKTCELIRQLIKLNAEVTAVLTPAAKEFVTETTLRTLTRNDVYSDQFSVKSWKPEHINLADNSDLFIIAPATANTISKIANGICDNLLTSLVAAFNKPVIIAPAMNCNMWNNNFIQENVTKLEKAGFYIIPPEEGDLACGYQGTGRMADIKSILNKTVDVLCEAGVCKNENDKAFLKGKKILITAGGTKEPIDPVRYIGNNSSGKMGIAIADAAYDCGADVVLISTVKVDKPYKLIRVESAMDMMNRVKEEFSDSDILIMAAAVADFRPAVQSEQKIKKGFSKSLTIELVKNPDILMEIAKIKKQNQIIIGFAAESENLINNAEKKLEEKNLDYIVANDISNREIGFNSDYNAVSIISKDGNVTEIPKNTKKQLAYTLLKVILGNI